MRQKLISKLTMVVTVFAMLLFSIAPAFAVTHGELDGDGHPQVVLIIMDVDGSPAYRCSGTLIAPTYVLTAGHCAGATGEFSGMRIFTESDVENGDNDYPFGTGNNTIEAVRWASHPDYASAAFFLHDVGMIELSESVVGVPYGSLPAVDSLDALKKRKQTTFTAVGYGLQRVAGNVPPWAQGKPPYEGERVRMVSNPHLLQINVPGFTGDFSLLLSNNASTGGTCFGDSGGPNFLGDSNVIAGVTSFGLNNSCGGTGGVFRMDRQNVQDFISAFMNP
ncbi:MAG: S1 family peptidase [Acidimicrobiia bacterium]